jgi:hypothetical protein
VVGTKTILGFNPRIDLQHIDTTFLRQRAVHTRECR